MAGKLGDAVSLGFVVETEKQVGAHLQSHLDAQERDILVRVLTETRFNRTAAAQRLGISLRQIRYRMERLRIDVPGEDRDKTP